MHEPYGLENSSKLPNWRTALRSIKRGVCSSAEPSRHVDDHYPQTGDSPPQIPLSVIIQKNPNVKNKWKVLRLLHSLETHQLGRQSKRSILENVRRGQESRRTQRVSASSSVHCQSRNYPRTRTPTEHLELQNHPGHNSAWKKRQKRRDRRLLLTSPNTRHQISSKSPNKTDHNNHYQYLPHAHTTLEGQDLISRLTALPHRHQSWMR